MCPTVHKGTLRFAKNQPENRGLKEQEECHSLAMRMRADNGAEQSEHTKDRKG